MIVKKLYRLAAALSVCATAAAQNPAAYFMEGSTLRSQFNPALAPRRGYFNIPALGGIDVGMNNDVALDRLLFTRGGRLVTILDREVSAADALAGLSADNQVGSDVRLSLLGFGKYARDGKTFWAVDINLRADAEFNLPRSLVEFAKRGDDGMIRNLSAAAESWVDAGFTYSFPLLDERLYLGFKAKLVIGGARARLDFDRLDVVLHEERWAVDAQGTLDAYIPGAAVDYRTDEAGRPYFEPSDIDVDGFRPAGYGMAFDLGATYDILPEFKASLSVTDLGFISWTARSAVRGTAVAHPEYTGVEIADGQSVSSPDFDLDDLMRFAPAEARGRTRMMHANLHAGLEYRLWRRRVAVGLLYQGRFRSMTTLHTLTAAVNYTPVGWFTLGGSYTQGSTGGSLGLALNLCPRWINLFVATDLLTARLSPQFFPVRQRTARVTLGLGVPIGRQGRRHVAAWMPYSARLAADR